MVSSKGRPWQRWGSRRAASGPVYDWSLQCDSKIASRSPKLETPAGGKKESILCAALMTKRDPVGMREYFFAEL